ncbi:MAG: HIT family protein [Nanoarchaeota archaeon]|nr:HIT family protein [Nanoarchaeota archaeon]
MKCDYCDIVQEKRNIIYEDNEVIAAVKDTALVPGQITIFPKEHVTIMELVPDFILQKCSVLANKVGMAIFEALGCQGTNVFIENGLAGGQKVPHFAIEVIPRAENDAIQLTWQPQQIADDELEVTASILKEELEKPVKVKEEKKAEEKPAEKMKEKENTQNYLLKALRRMP